MCVCVCRLIDDVDRRVEEETGRLDSAVRQIGKFLKTKCECTYHTHITERIPSLFSDSGFVACFCFVVLPQD